MKKFLSLLLLTSTVIGPAFSAELSSDELVTAIYSSNVVDKRIPLAVSVDKHQATVSMFVNRDSQTFENDSKIAALKIAKSLLDADPSLTAAVVQFKSQKLTDYIEIAVGGGDVTAYSAGRQTKDAIASTLELTRVPISSEQLQSDASSIASGKFSVSSSASALSTEKEAGAAGAKPNQDAKEAVGTLDTEPAALGASKPRDLSAKADKEQAQGEVDWLTNDNSKKSGSEASNADPGVDSLVMATGTGGTFKSLDNKSDTALPGAQGAAPPANPKDKLFKYGSLAFYYPGTWVQRSISRNDWATADEFAIAEFACRSRIGQPFINLSRFYRMGMQERLRTESELGTAFDLEVAPPEQVKIGYQGGIRGVSIISSGREGKLYFKRIYFTVGPDLYALTMRCKSAEAPATEKDFKRILGTLHSPRK